MGWVHKKRMFTKETHRAMRVYWGAFVRVANEVREERSKREMWLIGCRETTIRLNDRELWFVLEAMAMSYDEILVLWCYIQFFFSIAQNYF